MSAVSTEIIEAWPHILLAWSALALVAAAPGPTAMAIMGISMSHGRKAGFIFTAGCMSGATSWAILAGAGLSVWLTSYANGVLILKIIGGLYLLYMAFKSLRSAFASHKQAGNTIQLSQEKLYFKGLALHLTNPKAILGWAAVITLSQAGESSGESSLAVLVFTLAGCLMITFSIHFLYAALFASKTAMAVYNKARRWIEGLLAAVFGYAGLRLLSS